MIADFKNKGLITEGNNDQGEAIDQLNSICLGIQPPLSDLNPKGIPIKIAEAVLDEEGNVITPAQYSNEYHVDFIGEAGLDFNPARINPTTAQHEFAGWEGITVMDLK